VVQTKEELMDLEPLKQFHLKVDYDDPGAVAHMGRFIKFKQQV
jgi:hypothetical protein